MSDQIKNEQRWREARRRAEVLARLPDRPGEAEVQSAIGELGISRATLFRCTCR
jgi:putative transposase